MRKEKTTTIFTEDIELNSYKKIYFYRKITQNFKSFKEQILSAEDQSSETISTLSVYYRISFRESQDAYRIYEDENLGDLLRNTLNRKEYENFINRFNFANNNEFVLIFKPPELFSMNAALINQKNNTLEYFRKMSRQEAEKIFQFFLKEKLI